MTCRHCHSLLADNERAAYGGRCENCWVQTQPESEGGISAGLKARLRVFTLPTDCRGGARVVRKKLGAV